MSERKQALIDALVAIKGEADCQRIQFIIEQMIGDCHE